MSVDRLTRLMRDYDKHRDGVLDPIAVLYAVDCELERMEKKFEKRIKELEAGKEECDCRACQESRR